MRRCGHGFPTKAETGKARRSHRIDYGAATCRRCVHVTTLAQDIPGDKLEQLALLTIGAMAGTAIGLLIATVANSRD
jgi:hypothetical protein